MKKTAKRVLKRLSKTPLAAVLSLTWKALAVLHLACLELWWKLSRAPMPSKEEQALVAENATFVFKSFQRHSMAKRLYRNIRRYYPQVRVVIADDSREPLRICDSNLMIVTLPFNSGLSRGLNAALEQVQTPYVIRMDDDELLTPYSNFHGHLQYLMNNPQVDLVGISPRNLPLRGGWKKKITAYNRFSMSDAPMPLKIPHMTRLDTDHIVLGKVANIFIARTEPYRAVGYDNNIRMIDHHEFFFRAAGHLVSVLECNSYVLHSHNVFDQKYQAYRNDTKADLLYIRKKHGQARQKGQPKKLPHNTLI